MGILLWVVLGLVTGVVAKWMMPGKDPGEINVTILFGIVGAVVGGLLSSAIGFGGISGFDLRSMAIAVAGSIFLLVSYRLLGQKTTA